MTLIKLFYNTLLNVIRNKTLMDNSSHLVYSINNKQLEQKLSELGVDTSNIYCIGCNRHLFVKDIAGLHRVEDIFIFFCDRLDCQITASHRLLEIEQ